MLHGCGSTHIFYWLFPFFCFGNFTLSYSDTHQKNPRLARRTPRPAINIPKCAKVSTSYSLFRFINIILIIIAYTSYSQYCLLWETILNDFASIENSFQNVSFWSFLKNWFIYMKLIKNQYQNPYHNQSTIIKTFWH